MMGIGDLEFRITLFALSILTSEIHTDYLFFMLVLTLVMLNKLQCHAHFWLSASQIP